MNPMLLTHGCSNVFNVPEGLKELMSDITREVLRAQPDNICNFIANYLSALLITREHGIVATRVLEDLCDCKLTIAERLAQIGYDPAQCNAGSVIIQEAIEQFDPDMGEKFQERAVIRKLIAVGDLNVDTATKACYIIRDTYTEYWKRRKYLEHQELTKFINEPWELAARKTIEVYAKTKPTFEELNRACVRIQAAYRGYHLRRKVLKRMMEPKDDGAESSRTPSDAAGSREIDLGPKMGIEKQDDELFQGIRVQKTSSTRVPDPSAASVTSDGVLVDVGLKTGLTESDIATRLHDALDSGDDEIPTVKAGSDAYVDIETIMEHLDDLEKLGMGYGEDTVRFDIIKFGDDEHIDDENEVEDAKAEGVEEKAPVEDGALKAEIDEELAEDEDVDDEAELEGDDSAEGETEHENPNDDEGDETDEGDQPNDV